MTESVDKQRHEEEQKLRKIADRMRSTEKLFISVATSRKWPHGVYLNTSILENLFEHYFRDVDETKDKHEIINADRHKRAAFTMKWLMRLRPIQIERGVKISKTDILIANELFACFAALEHLEISFRDIDENWLRNLLFTLRYRDFCAEAMGSEMYLLEQAVSPASNLSNASISPAQAITR